MVTVRYGFQTEVNKKYGVSLWSREPLCPSILLSLQSGKAPLLDLFKDLFSWLPLYSYVDAGTRKLIILHGGISDRINLKKLNTLARNRCR